MADSCAAPSGPQWRKLAYSCGPTESVKQWIAAARATTDLDPGQPVLTTARTLAKEEAAHAQPA